MGKVLSYLLVLPLALAASAAQADEVEIELGGAVATLEIARTEDERTAGLSNRDEVPEGTGMLFVFDKPTAPCFWMRNTLVALDAAFVARNGVVVAVHGMEPETEEVHCAPVKVRWVIETPAGWLAERGILPGHRLAAPALGVLEKVARIE